MTHLYFAATWIGFALASIGSAISPPKSRVASVTLAVLGLAIAAGSYFWGAT